MESNNSIHERWPTIDDLMEEFDLEVCPQCGEIVDPRYFDFESQIIEFLDTGLCNSCQKG